MDIFFVNEYDMVWRYYDYVNESVAQSQSKLALKSEDVKKKKNILER